MDCDSGHEGSLTNFSLPESLGEILIIGYSGINSGFAGTIIRDWKSLYCRLG
jgi:hypothetical protein